MHVRLIPSVSGETFRVTKEELQNSGVWYEDALELEDGDYQGGLGMMHELHCLVCAQLLMSTIEGHMLNFAFLFVPQAWVHQSYASRNTSVFEREEHVIGHLGESIVPHVHTHFRGRSLCQIANLGHGRPLPRNPSDEC